jgi:hypothetical protein
MMIKPNEFGVGDRVFHVTPESPEGVVIDARYSLLTGMWEYQVSFGPCEPSLWYYDIELVHHRTFNSGTYKTTEG